jgi:SAM-dependent methyltransferase
MNWPVHDVILYMNPSCTNYHRYIVLIGTLQAAMVPLFGIFLVSAFEHTSLHRHSRPCCRRGGDSPVQHKGSAVVVVIPRQSCWALSVSTDDVSEVLEDDNDNDDNARSQFGTRQYWDDTYLGRGDFPAEEYSWYFGWEILREYVQEYILPPSNIHNNKDDVGRILCPGIGNDPLLVDLYRAKCHQLTAFDYSQHAIARQQDLLAYDLPATAMETIELHTLDARKLPDPDWNEHFSAIIEKGTLDAIYLSGDDGNVERAVENLYRVLKPGGVCISVSGVVPETLRRTIFQEWEWIRDGSEELKAGCFVFRKPKI